MALLIPILTMITKFAIQIFITLFGWATIIFFGKIPGKKSTYISIMSILSLLWMILFIGIFLPEVTQFVFGLFPDIIKKNRWIMRLLNSFGVFILPLFVGGISLMMQTKARKKGRSRFKQILLGYYYALDLGTAMLLMLFFAPIIQIKQYIKREKSSHTPIMMQDGEYEEVLQHLQKSLQENKIPSEVQWPEALYAIPMKIMDQVFSQLLDTFGSHHHRMLKGEAFQLYIHPTDLMIVGKEETVQRIRSIVAKSLAFENTYMTWDEESHFIEDKLSQIYREFKENPHQKEKYLKSLCQLEEQLSKVSLPYDEWEVVYRELLMVEKEMMLFQCK